MSFPKPSTRERFCSKEYLNFIRSLPCEICKQKENRFSASQPSHMKSSKYADGSDALAVPACQSHHPQSTRSARKVFEDAGIDIQLFQEGLWRVFLISHRLDCPDLVTQQIFEIQLENAGMRQAPRTTKDSLSTFEHYGSPF